MVYKFTKLYNNEDIEMNKNDLANMYLEYWNNFLTIDRFAEYYNLSRYEASKIIDLGRTYHEDSVKEYKLTIKVR